MDFVDMSDGELEDTVIGHAGQLAAQTCTFLDALREFDTRGAWNGVNIRSCAQWLSWKTGLSRRTAQDQLRVAHALADLPHLHDAFAHGRLSYSKVRAVSRVATADSEPELVDIALSSTAEQVERLCRGLRTINRRGTPDAAPADSTARWNWDDDGTLRVSMRLNPVDGARFLAGVVRSDYERTRTIDDPDVPTPPESPGSPGSSDASGLPTDLWRNVPSNIAPAVVAMSDIACDMIDVPETAPGAEVLIVEDSATGDAHIDDGPPLDTHERDEARCDAIVRAVRVQQGAVLAWGRRRRTPSPAQIRAVFMRDRCCTMPGCGRTRFLHVHHVAFWSHGGATDLDNLVLLCGEHHRRLHRDEFSIVPTAPQQFEFHTAAGDLIEVAPPIAAEPRFRPDRTTAPAAIVPNWGGEKLDLSYATDVLTHIWALRAREKAADTTPPEAMAA